MEENLEGQVVTTGRRQDSLCSEKNGFRERNVTPDPGKIFLSSMEAMAKLHTVMQAEQDEDMPGQIFWKSAADTTGTSQNQKICTEKEGEKPV